MNLSGEEKKGDRVVQAKAHVKFADGEDCEILKQQPKVKGTGLATQSCS
jgi:hypothetical protein